MSSHPHHQTGRVGGMGDGQARIAALVAHLLDGEPSLPAYADWLSELRRLGDGPLRGIRWQSIPLAWRAAVLHVGIPVSADEAAESWDDCCLLADSFGEAADGRLQLPADPAALLQASGVDLKPVRRWAGARWGCRLQAAPGLVFLLWPAQALVVSTHELPLAGFLHGPSKGERHVLALQPGGMAHLRFR